VRLFGANARGTTIVAVTANALAAFVPSLTTASTHGNWRGIQLVSCTPTISLAELVSDSNLDIHALGSGRVSVVETPTLVGNVDGDGKRALAFYATSG
jgi:hypothetical protein